MPAPLQRHAATLLALLLFTGPIHAQSVRQAAVSPHGMVSAAHPLATDAGVRILEMGGNAADAAVATGFAVAVVEPTMNSIGGRNQILVRTPDGAFHGIDGTTKAPDDYDPETAPRAGYGYPVIGIPGALDGLLKLHRDHGSLPLETLLAPAIEYAEQGFRVLPGDAARQAAAAAEALEFPGTSAAYYKPDGSPYRAGELLRQPDYAWTLRAIAQGGREVFYEGVIGRRMAEDLAANGSTVRYEAIRDYEALDAGIVRGSYRGYDLIGLDVPAAGAVTIQALQTLEYFDPAGMTEPEWFALVGQALGAAAPELRALGSDTAAARVTSKAWARSRAEALRVPVGAVLEAAVAPGPAVDPASTAFEPGPDHQGHTTHLSVADAEGMVVSLTQTLGPNMGSKVVTPGLGFLYASTLGGYLSSVGPGTRARSYISPFMVAKDGEVLLVLGAAGGGMIPPAVVHAITRVIDFGESLPVALAEPRVAHATGGAFNAETSPGIGWTGEELTAMRALGIEIREVERSGAFGRVHGLQYDPANGVWIGAADPDWEGSARGPVRTRR
jgi:gamma-glutamyltranspeptidase/glutathione hydrolase